MTAPRRVTFGMVAALLAATACSGSARVNKHAAGFSPPPVAPTPTSRAYVTQVQQRNRDTATYAQSLAAHAPRISGEVAFTGTPPKDIRRADETIGVSNLMIRSRYWTVQGSPDAVYRALKKTHVAGLRLTGYGLPSSPAEEPPGHGFLHWDPTDPPPYIADVELYVEMEKLTNGRTIIAAFGEAAAYPVRVAAETIPVTGSHVVVTKTRHTLRQKVLSRRKIAFSPAMSRALTGAFNASPTSSPGNCIGGIGPTYAYRIMITSGGHTWEATFPATCFGVTVQRDGLALNNLEPSPDFRRILRLAFLVNRGMIQGRLLGVGGPAGAKPAHIYGHLTLRQHGRVVVHRRTNGAGAFSFSAPSGRYTLTGGSAYAKVDGHGDRCSAPHQVVVRPNRATRANIYCQFR